MTEIVMPAKYRQMVQHSYRESLIDDNIKDEAEVGSPRVRARTTRIRTRVSYQFILTSKSEANEFDEFVKNTLKVSLMPFVWVNNRTDETLIMRLENSPTKSAIAPEAFIYAISMSEV